ncbi:MAG: hypothetical protein C4326_12025 [Ignavibacteria bacterium]
MNTEHETKRLTLVAVLLAAVLGGCGATNNEPVAIFPEDICGQCRMAISDERFAAEIIDSDGEAYKFDDIGCMVKSRSRHTDMKINAIFLKDYETKEWIPYERASIVETSIETPMGSGKLAFGSAERARVVHERHPAAAKEDGCSIPCGD